tara:strand:+ start:641 stop:793 length:153 start_codon:yes stop_codon:yes gene_type:complete
MRRRGESGLSEGAREKEEEEDVDRTHADRAGAHHTILLHRILLPHPDLSR